MPFLAFSDTKFLPSKLGTAESRNGHLSRSTKWCIQKVMASHFSFPPQGVCQPAPVPTSPTLPYLHAQKTQDSIPLLTLHNNYWKEFWFIVKSLLVQLVLNGKFRNIRTWFQSIPKQSVSITSQVGNWGKGIFSIWWLIWFFPEWVIDRGKGREQLNCIFQ